MGLLRFDQVRTYSPKRICRPSAQAVWRLGPCDSESNPNGRHYVTTIPPQEGKQPAVKSAIRGKAKRSIRGRGTDAQPPERLWAGTNK